MPRREIVIIAVVDGGEGLADITVTRNPLDTSVACRTIYERIAGAAASLNARLRITRAPRDALQDTLLETDTIILVADALGGFVDHEAAFRSAVEAYIETPGETLVFATKPYTRRGIPLDVKGSTLNRVGEGGDIFAGIVVGRYSALADKLRNSPSLHELLSKLTGSRVRYWPEPWLRLEDGFDVLLYNMLYMERLRESRISKDAVISPTAVIEGPVLIEEGVRIEHYAVVKGPAVLCRGSFIGLHATVRSYSALEPRTRIGAYSEVYVTSMQRGATASSHTYITGSVIGENAHVEPFSVTKVVYGEAAAKKLGVVAPFTPELRAGCVARAGTRIPAGSVVEPLTRL